MKKIIALALCLLMMLTLFVGCKDKNSGDLLNAKEYLITMYQTNKNDEPMKIEIDKDVLSSVTVDGVSYAVEWAVSITEGAADAVKIAESETANCVKIDIPELTEKDILFTAVATIKDEKGNTETAEFSYKVFGVEVATDVTEDDDATESVLDKAYKLEEGKSLDGDQTLTGVITSVDTAYNSQYKNVTVTIVVDNNTDKPIKCYRLAGDKADKLAVGDTITVTGTITNYNGTIEFAQGCLIKKYVKGDGSANNSTTSSKPSSTTSSKPSSTTSSKPSTSTSTSTGLKLVTDTNKILKDAFKLGKNETTPYIAQLTGKVISVDKAYDAQYGSVSVTMVVSGKNIVCWQMKGTGTDKVKAGDTITVKGVIKNFYYEDSTTGKVEFTYDAASQTEVVMIKRVAGKEETKELSIVASPKTGVAYKFGFYQEEQKKNLFATGTMNGYYMATTESASVAVDVYLEKATGGYYLYTKIDGVKKYFNMVSTGTHVNAVFSDKADMVFTYDADKKTLISSKELEKNGEKATYVFGTYGSYTTIGTSSTKYDTTYCCHLYK